MRHYLWYRSDGSIGGPETMDFGFPAEIDPRDPDPDTADPVAQTIRGYRIGVDDHAGWHLYDCGCDPTVRVCGHAAERFRDSYVQLPGDVLASRDRVEFLVDGVVTAPNSAEAPLNKLPAGSVSFKLREKSPGDVPDGTVAKGYRLGTVDLAEAYPVELTFTGGESSEATLVAPSQGVKGGIVFTQGMYCAESQLWIRGWPA